MYQVVYYYKEREGQSVVEKEFHGENFRLRRNALRYVLELVQSDYREKGYATEPMVGGIFCYNSEKTSNGERKITAIRIKVEKA